MKEEKRKYYIKIGTFIAIVVIAVITVIILFSNKEKTVTEKNTNATVDKDKQDSYNKLSEEDLAENIKIEAIGITESGDFAFKVRNNNNQDVYVKGVNTIFKDDNGNFIEKVESQSQYFIVKANSEVVDYAWGYKKDFKKYNRYEFEIQLSQDYMEDRFVVKNLEIKENNTGEQIAIEIKNNNNFNINYLTVMVAYYNNGKIVGCVTGFNMETTKANGIAYMNVAYPQNANYKEVDFDNYKVYLLSSEVE